MGKKVIELVTFTCDDCGKEFKRSEKIRSIQGLILDGSEENIYINAQDSELFLCIPCLIKRIIQDCAAEEGWSIIKRLQTYLLSEQVSIKDVKIGDTVVANTETKQESVVLPKEEFNIETKYGFISLENALKITEEFELDVNINKLKENDANTKEVFRDEFEKYADGLEPDILTKILETYFDIIIYEGYAEKAKEYNDISTLKPTNYILFTRIDNDEEKEAAAKQLEYQSYDDLKGLGISLTGKYIITNNYIENSPRQYSNVSKNTEKDIQFLTGTKKGILKLPVIYKSKELEIPLYITNDEKYVFMRLADIETLLPEHEDKEINDSEDSNDSNE